MRLVLEIEKFYEGTFGKEGQKQRPLTRISGRDQNGRWAEAVSWDSHATALSTALTRIVGDDEDIATRRLVAELKGEWRERITKGPDGKDRPQRSFAIAEFVILNGPSLELARSRRDGSMALKEAAVCLKEGNMASAYRALEAFVASHARQPAPSKDMDMDVERELGVDETPSDLVPPEEAALARLAEQDARAGIAVQAQQQPASEKAAEAQTNASDPEAEKTLSGGAPVASSDEHDVLDEAPEPARMAPAQTPTPAAQPRPQAQMRPQPQPQMRTQPQPAPRSVAPAASRPAASPARENASPAPAPAPAANQAPRSMGIRRPGVPMRGPGM